MPFGLKNAGVTFVRVVRMILRQIREFSESYVDDKGVGSGCWSEHLGHRRQFLCVIRRVGMTLTLAKCVWTNGTFESFRIWYLYITLCS